jgi:hypothetical protein
MFAVACHMKRHSTNERNPFSNSLPAYSYCCSFVAALQQRLAAMAGPSVACLASCMPLLVPSGGALRLWRQVGGLLQEQVSRCCCGLCL